VDKTNNKILIQYKPPDAATAIPINQVVQLVIKQDQNIQPLFKMPITAGQHKITIRYQPVATNTLIGAVTLNTFEKQLNMFNARTFIDNQGEWNILKLKFIIS
jgi:hypothetical protein